MRHRYRITYVGNDSQEHVAVVKAADHQSAANKLRREAEVDMVIRISRAKVPGSAVFQVLKWVALLAVLVIVVWYAKQAEKTREEAEARPVKRPQPVENVVDEDVDLSADTK